MNEQRESDVKLEEGEKMFWAAEFSTMCLQLQEAEEPL